MNSFPKEVFNVKLTQLGTLASRRRLALAMTGAAAFALALGSSSVAHAQYAPRPYYAPPPPPGYYPPAPAGRSGLVAGVSLGFGGLSADQCGSDCGGGFSLEGHLGGMIDPRLALMFDGWAVFHSNSDQASTTTSAIYSGALQLWITPMVWIKGGLGIGDTHISDALGRLGQATAFALMGAVGVELVRTGPFVLDLQGRLGHSFFSDADGGAVTNYAFLLGFNYY
jgi:hypothetical protein